MVKVHAWDQSNFDLLIFNGPGDHDIKVDRLPKALMCGKIHYFFGSLTGSIATPFFKQRSQ
jgi:hypothetical protein